MLKSTEKINFASLKEKLNFVNVFELGDRRSCDDCFLSCQCSVRKWVQMELRLVLETFAILCKIDWLAGESLWHMYNLRLGDAVRAAVFFGRCKFPLWRLCFVFSI